MSQHDRVLYYYYFTLAVKYTVLKGIPYIKLLHICAINQLSSIDMFNVLLETSFLRLGMTAVVSLAILMIVSLRVIRTRVYEVFFYTHFVAVL